MPIVNYREALLSPNHNPLVADYHGTWGNGWVQTLLAKNGNGIQKDHKGAIELWRQLFGDRFPAYG